MLLHSSMAQQEKALAIKIKADPSLPCTCDPPASECLGIASMVPPCSVLCSVETEPSATQALCQLSSTPFTTTCMYSPSIYSFILILQNLITNLRSGQTPDPTESINDHGQDGKLFSEKILLKIVKHGIPRLVPLPRGWHPPPAGWICKVTAPSSVESVIPTLNRKEEHVRGPAGVNYLSVPPLADPLHIQV